MGPQVAQEEVLCVSGRGVVCIVDRDSIIHVVKKKLPYLRVIRCISLIGAYSLISAYRSAVINIHC